MLGSVDLGKCGSIYTQECWKSLARNYDICCLFFIIVNEMKFVISEVVTREFCASCQTRELSGARVL